MDKMLAAAFVISCPLLLSGATFYASPSEGIASEKSLLIHSRHYITLLIEKGLVARTDPENPMSPRQEYKLA